MPGGLPGLIKELDSDDWAEINQWIDENADEAKLLLEQLFEPVMQDLDMFDLFSSFSDEDIRKLFKYAIEHVFSQEPLDDEVKLDFCQMLEDEELAPRASQESQQPPSQEKSERKVPARLAPNACSWKDKVVGKRRIVSIIKPAQMCLAMETETSQVQSTLGTDAEEKPETKPADKVLAGWRGPVSGAGNGHSDRRNRKGTPLAKFMEELAGQSECESHARTPLDDAIAEAVHSATTCVEATRRATLEQALGKETSADRGQVDLHPAAAATRFAVDWERRLSQLGPFEAAMFALNMEEVLLDLKPHGISELLTMYLETETWLNALDDELPGEKLLRFLRLAPGLCVTGDINQESVCVKDKGVFESFCKEAKERLGRAFEFEGGFDSMPPCHMRDKFPFVLEAGMPVVIRGLVRVAELNGQEALCTGRLGDTGRYSVRLATGENKAIKAENLRPRAKAWSPERVIVELPSEAIPVHIGNELSQPPAKNEHDYRSITDCPATDDIQLPDTKQLSQSMPLFTSQAQSHVLAKLAALYVSDLVGEREAESASAHGQFLTGGANLPGSNAAPSGSSHSQPSTAALPSPVRRGRSGRPGSRDRFCEDSASLRAARALQVQAVNCRSDRTLDATEAEANSHHVGTQWRMVDSALTDSVDSNAKFDRVGSSVCRGVRDPIRSSIASTGDGGEQIISSGTSIDDLAERLVLLECLRSRAEILEDMQVLPLTRLREFALQHHSSDMLPHICGNESSLRQYLEARLPGCRLQGRGVKARLFIERSDLFEACSTAISEEVRAALVWEGSSGAIPPFQVRQTLIDARALQERAASSRSCSSSSDAKSEASLGSSVEYGVLGGGDNESIHGHPELLVSSSGTDQRRSLTTRMIEDAAQSRSRSSSSSIRSLSLEEPCRINAAASSLEDPSCPDLTFAERSGSCNTAPLLPDASFAERSSSCNEVPSFPDATFAESFVAHEAVPHSQSEQVAYRDEKLAGPCYFAAGVYSAQQAEPAEDIWSTTSLGGEQSMLTEDGSEATYTTEVLQLREKRCARRKRQEPLKNKTDNLLSALHQVRTNLAATKMGERNRLEDLRELGTKNLYGAQKLAQIRQLRDETQMVGVSIPDQLQASTEDLRDAIQKTVAQREQDRRSGWQDNSEPSRQFAEQLRAELREDLRKELKAEVRAELHAELQTELRAVGVLAQKNDEMQEASDARSTQSQPEPEPRQDSVSHLAENAEKPIQPRPSSSKSDNGDLAAKIDARPASQGTKQKPAMSSGEAWLAAAIEAGDGDFADNTPPMFMDQEADNRVQVADSNAVGSSQAPASLATHTWRQHGKPKAEIRRWKRSLASRTSGTGNDQDKDHTGNPEIESRRIFKAKRAEPGLEQTLVPMSREEPVPARRVTFSCDKASRASSTHSDRSSKHRVKQEVNVSSRQRRRRQQRNWSSRSQELHQGKMLNEEEHLGGLGNHRHHKWMPRAAVFVRSPILPHPLSTDLESTAKPNFNKVGKHFAGLDAREKRSWYSQARSPVRFIPRAYQGPRLQDTTPHDSGLLDEMRGPRQSAQHGASE